MPAGNITQARHSNSFLELLEHVDPWRFARGVRIRGRGQLEGVIVRRPRESPRKRGVEPFPKRTLPALSVSHPSTPGLQPQLTILQTRHDALVRVIVLGRLSLFGKRAARLHDELVSLAARWVEGKESDLMPFAERADRKAIALLEDALAESPSLNGVSQSVQAKLFRVAPSIFARLWPAIRDPADRLARAAEKRLAQRRPGQTEARKILLHAQRAAIGAEIDRRAPVTLAGLHFDKPDEEQFRKEEKHLRNRLEQIQLEIDRAPRPSEALDRVTRGRLEPVGMVLLWPESRG